jgi:hypothetical protein
MTSLDEARKKALEAREKMLNARPKDTTIPPLPDKIVPDHTHCLHYFESAVLHYGVAERAYAAGDFVTGHMYEAFAYQDMLLGQACVDQST